MMRREACLFGIVLVSLMVLGLGVPPLVAQQDELQPGPAMATQELAVFAEANMGSGKLATLQPGDMVNVLEVDGEWARLEYGDIAGWSLHSVSTLPPLLVNVYTSAPSARGYHQMTYDVESDRVILFGGLSGNLQLNDTWSYDVETNTWTEMAPAQSPPPGEGPLAYDSRSDRAILVLGTIGWPPPTRPASQTWAYDFNTDTWTNLEPAYIPLRLTGARMVYDSESDRMILFGGVSSVNILDLRTETWAYDLTSNTWTKMDPEVSPPGMSFHPMAYDAGADRVILSGSSSAAEFANDIWIYDYNTDTWEVRQPAEGPKRRDYSAMVYAAATGQMILFGQGEPGLPKNDTWSYDFDTNTWTELEPDVAPSKRGWHAMVYSTATDQVVLFGGGRSRQDSTLETWIYHPGANTWTQVGP